MTRPDISTAPVSHLAVAPPTVAQRQSADWGLVQAEQVDIIRHEPFSYEFKGSRHLLVASERAERYDGETLVDGLPRSNRRAWSRRMSFIPAGHRFYGWQKPRALTRSTFLYIDPLSPLLCSELRFTEVEFKPRLFFFDLDIWETALKLKAQLANSCRSQKAYVEALGIA
jgi:AraC family transcriptional regulator